MMIQSQKDPTYPLRWEAQNQKQQPQNDQRAYNQGQSQLHENDPRLPQPPAYQQTSYHDNNKKVINEIHDNKDNKETLDYITELNTQRQEENRGRTLIKDKQNEERDVKMTQVIYRLATPESSIGEEQNVVSKVTPWMIEDNQQGQKEHTISVETKTQNRDKATTIPEKEKESNGQILNNILSNQHAAEDKPSIQHFLDKTEKNHQSTNK
ncbi:unnamed protein product [Mytilus coruscus]|uniref:Uncharacterized protein n=1 Tax=Mytilus coruscus TaxID=42192 RepID=A0A6J8A8L8_MYTCO|nr:unnamed protein product [Mytilus coruscus]